MSLLKSLDFKGFRSNVPWHVPCIPFLRADLLNQINCVAYGCEQGLFTDLFTGCRVAIRKRVTETSRE
jgi:hypothetical protein